MLLTGSPGSAWEPKQEALPRFRRREGRGRGASLYEFDLLNMILV